MTVLLPTNATIAAGVLLSKKISGLLTDSRLLTILLLYESRINLKYAL